ncbi:MAG: DUF4112 domain-containing protein [Pseudomonadota bacterium]|nr:DUF4112 domain-containing protein [Pseudomonadota bacterium]
MTAPSSPPDQTNNQLERLRRLARTLDSSFQLPGTRFRFGLDSLIGLVPGVGDGASFAVSLYFIGTAHRLGVRKRTLVRMLWNLGVDFVVGAIPLIGDLFDFGWKANLRNMELIERDLARQGRPVRPVDTGH